MKNNQKKKRETNSKIEKLSRTTVHLQLKDRTCQND